MPMEMPKGLPFSVDTWSPKSDLKRHHFLTHAHKDHLASIASHASFPIYCTPVTKSLVLRLFPQIEAAVFVEIQVGEEVVVRDRDGDFTVTAFDANHCPGAVMFLFEGEFGNVLHTGDCRLTDNCLQNLPLKYIVKKKKENICHLDYLFLDCTFGRCPLKFPSKLAAIRQIISCIWKHPHAPNVYLAADLLGQEDILVEVCQTFGSKLYIDKNILPECFDTLQLVAPDILSEDKYSRFQIIEGFPKLYERASIKLAEVRAKMQPEPLFIRPSSQWYACEESQGSQPPDKPILDEAIRDEFGIWHVCYSMHSSRSELESSLHVLQPKWVISTTPPCRAMELDYVKRHCYKTQMTEDDPLWKLLKLGGGKSVRPVVSKVSKISLSTEVGTRKASTSVEETQLRLESAVSMEAVMDSPPKETPITLFGKARLGLQEPYYMFHESKMLETAMLTGVDYVVTESNSLETIIPSEAHGLILESKALEINVPKTDTEGEDMQANAFSKPTEESFISKLSFLQDDKSNEFDSLKCRKDCELKKEFSYELPFTGYSATFRKMFRSRNVPVPQPLPSLKELMNSKRARVEL